MYDLKTKMGSPFEKNKHTKNKHTSWNCTHTHKPRKDNIERATQIHKKAAIKFNSPNIKSNFLNDTHKFKYKLLFYLAAIAIL